MSASSGTTANAKSETGKEFGMFLEKKEAVWQEHREQQGRGGQKVGRDWII